MRGNEELPKELKYASSFVNQLLGLYEDEGFRELTPGLVKELSDSIKILEKYKNYERWVQFTLATAYRLQESMPEIKFFKIGNPPD